MEAGDLFHTWIDTVDLSVERIAVRAHVFTENRETCGVGDLGACSKGART